MRKIIENKKGVSEVVGTILMLGMAIALFSFVYIVAMNFIPFTPNAPSVRISGELNNNIIYLLHNGGDSLPLDTKVIFSNDETGDTIGNVKLVNFKFKTDGGKEWNIGEMIYYPTGNPSDLDFNGIKSIQMIIVDVKSNSIITQDIFSGVK